MFGVWLAVTRQFKHGLSCLELRRPETFSCLVGFRISLGTARPVGLVLYLTHPHWQPSSAHQLNFSANIFPIPYSLLSVYH
jgi:hypothetical protein